MSVVLKYPLACGCAGPKYVSMCDAHQAEARALHARKLGAVPPVKTWRCFHCDEVFTDRDKAQEHFGRLEDSAPACSIDIAEYRRMEEVNRRHIEEDTELHRELCRKDTELNIAVRRAEEEGYAKALKDARTL